jgi:hypothetical protein
MSAPTNTYDESPLPDYGLVHGAALAQLMQDVLSTPRQVTAIEVAGGACCSGHLQLHEASQLRLTLAKEAEDLRAGRVHLTVKIPSGCYLLSGRLASPVPSQQGQRFYPEDYALKLQSRESRRVTVPRRADLRLTDKSGRSWDVVDVSEGGALLGVSDETQRPHPGHALELSLDGESLRLVLNRIVHERPGTGQIGVAWTPVNGETMRMLRRVLNALEISQRRALAHTTWP